MGKKRKVVLGEKTIILLPNGDRHNAQFAIVELDDIIPSHNHRTFASSDGYPVTPDGHNINDRNYADDKSAQASVQKIAQFLEPSLIISNQTDQDGTPIISKDFFVLSGNNRTMSLKLAKEDYPNSIKRYELYLEANAGCLGISDAALAGFTTPTAVRFDYDVEAYTTAELAKFNQSRQKGERPVDEAIKLSHILKTKTDCRNALIAIISRHESFSELTFGDERAIIELLTSQRCALLNYAKLPTYWDGSRGLTDAGKKYVRTLALASVLDKDSLIAGEYEGTVNVTNKLAALLPQLTENIALADGSLRQPINDSIIIEDRLNTWKKRQPQMKDGEAWVNYLTQMRIMHNDFGEKTFTRKALILNRLYAQPYATRLLKEAFEKYNHSTKQMDTTQVQMLFGTGGEVDEFESKRLENELLQLSNEMEHLECDGFTRVLTYALKKKGIPHRVMIGSMMDTEKEGSIIPLHFWIELGNGQIIDFRARMWLGNEAPHGIVTDRKRFIYEGKPIELDVDELTYQILSGSIFKHKLKDVNKDELKMGGKTVKKKEIKIKPEPKADQPLNADYAFDFFFARKLPADQLKIIDNIFLANIQTEDSKAASRLRLQMMELEHSI